MGFVFFCFFWKGSARLGSTNTVAMVTLARHAGISGRRLQQIRKTAERDRKKKKKRFETTAIVTSPPACSRLSLKSLCKPHKSTKSLCTNAEHQVSTIGSCCLSSVFVPHSARMACTSSDGAAVTPVSCLLVDFERF